MWNPQFVSLLDLSCITDAWHYVQNRKRHRLPGGIPQSLKEEKEVKNLSIEKVIGREILDSRGNPTL